MALVKCRYGYQSDRNEKVRMVIRFLCLSLLLSAFVTTLARQPNVILILTDDTGYGDMSCHGNPYLKTPALDRMHAEGVRLTDFHVDPTCAPTRGALMTGRYSSRVGVWLTYGSRHHLRRDEATIADAFQEDGYRTAIFGKWHLGDNYPFRPMDRGFDESLIHGGGVIGETPDYWDNNYYDDVYFRNGKPEKVSGYCTDVWFNEAQDFISRNKDRPFFVYIPTNAAHAPHHIPSKYKEGFKKRGSFYGMIVNIDENIQKLRDKLQELSLERDTIVIFLNDNGTAGGAGLSHPNGDNGNGWEVDGFNAGMRGRKSSAYEGGHRAACFLVWPNGGLAGGRDIDGLTSHIDLMPTLIDLCGLKFSERLPFDGASLKPYLRENSPEVPVRTLFVHHQGRFGTRIEDGLLIKDKDYSVMRDNWRLVGDELYDIKTDPGQRNDIAAEFPEVSESLRQEYESWWESISEKGNENCAFVVNPSKQRTVQIDSQNLLGANVAYNQRHVRMGMLIPDSWTFIDVEKAGRYRISLRRWPREADARIHGIVPDLQLHPSTHAMKKFPINALKVTKAQLMIGDVSETKNVRPSDKEVVFEVDLPEGEQRIQTRFTMENGERTAAYFTYIEPMEETL